jgi:Putative zinc-binding metallo-peptidase
MNHDFNSSVNRFFLIAMMISALIWCIAESFEIYSNKTFSKAQIDKMFEPITSRYGLKIVYEVGDHFFSDLVNPIIPAGPPRDSKVTPIRHRVLARYPEILQRALSKYPTKVIKEYLKGIYFAGELDQHGFKAGGSYDPFRRIIYIVDNGGKDENQGVYTVHHELSSLLLKHHTFYVNPWTDNNPNGYKYLYKTTDDTLKTFNNTSLVGTEADYEKGFMDSYGQTNFENDFNEYSAMIFTYPEKFSKIMHQYPRVRGKFLVWLDFYHMIDPTFTEDYLLGGAGHKSM